MRNEGLEGFEFTLDLLTDAKKARAILAGRGPSLSGFGLVDHLTTVADELVPDTITIVELGFDHFYRDPEINLKSMAIANLVADELNTGSTLRKSAE